MATIQGANSGSPGLYVGATNFASRGEPRPTDYATFGHYSAALSSGIIPVIGTFGANGEIMQWRWSDTTRLCLIRKVTLDVSITTTMAAAGVPLEIAMLKSSAWSGVGTGGTRPTFGTQCKMRSTMGSTLLGANDVGISTTAALGAGTKTLETTPIANAIAGMPITNSLTGITLLNYILFDANMGDGGHPLTFATQEGFSLTVVNAPGTGTWRLGVKIQWCELASF